MGIFGNWFTWAIMLLAPVFDTFMAALFGGM